MAFGSYALGAARAPNVIDPPCWVRKPGVRLLRMAPLKKRRISRAWPLHRSDSSPRDRSVKSNRRIDETSLMILAADKSLTINYRLAWETAVPRSSETRTSTGFANFPI